MHSNSPTFDSPKKPKTTYIHSGIGGYGNYQKLDQAKMPLLRRATLRIQPREDHFSGIGGCGNFQKSGSSNGDPCRSIEPIAKSPLIGKSPKAFHIGIGGAGNRAVRPQVWEEQDGLANTSESEKRQLEGKQSQQQPNVVGRLNRKLSTMLRSQLP